MVTLLILFPSYLLIYIFYIFSELLASVLHILEEIEACTARRQQYSIT